MSYAKFVTDMEAADEAMQAALRSCPDRKLAVEVTQRTFQEVRDTLVMAHGLQREAQARGESDAGTRRVDA